MYIVVIRLLLFLYLNISSKRKFFIYMKICYFVFIFFLNIFKGEKVIYDFSLIDVI